MGRAVNRAGKIAVALVAVGSLAVAGRYAVRAFLASPTGETFVSRSSAILSPGPLADVHRDLAGTAECTDCHGAMSRIGNEKCVTCHAAVGDRIAAKTGFHGTALTGECATCHVDHRAKLIDFDPSAFNHRLSTFPLEGAHAGLACARCHERPSPRSPRVAVRMQWIDIAHESCETCHADPHGGALTAGGKTCVSCHDQVRWTGRDLAFHHNQDTRFPLRGAHVNVSCEKCHAPPAGKALAAADFARAPVSCAGCHEDPHAGQFADASCAACHREDSFGSRDLFFRHSDVATFPLTGAHAAVECAKCHAPAKPVRWRGASTECASCHADPHAGTLAPKSCTDCHDTSAWNGDHLRFDHARDSRFALDAVHAALACAACHATRAYRPAATDCAGCHQRAVDELAGRLSVAGSIEQREPSPHDGLVECVRCHDTSRPRESPADLAQKCAGCHTPRYAALQLQQRALLATLIDDARRRLDDPAVPPERRARLLVDLSAVEAAGGHDHAAAEARAREILEAAGH